MLSEIMNKYLPQVEEDFDRQELLYLELIDAFSVRGVHLRLLELRAALDSNADVSVIAAKRMFIDGVGVRWMLILDFVTIFNSETIKCKQIIWLT